MNERVTGSYGAEDYFIRERGTIDNPFSCFITANESQRRVCVLLVLWVFVHSVSLLLCLSLDSETDVFVSVSIFKYLN